MGCLLYIKPTKEHSALGISARDHFGLKGWFRAGKVTWPGYSIYKNSLDIRDSQQDVIRYHRPIDSSPHFLA